MATLVQFFYGGTKKNIHWMDKELSSGIWFTYADKFAKAYRNLRLSGLCELEHYTTSQEIVVLCVLSIYF